MIIIRGIASVAALLILSNLKNTIGPICTWKFVFINITIAYKSWFRCIAFKVKILSVKNMEYVYLFKPTLCFYFIFKLLYEMELLTNNNVSKLSSKNPPPSAFGAGTTCNQMGKGSSTQVLQGLWFTTWVYIYLIYIRISIVVKNDFTIDKLGILWKVLISNVFILLSFFLNISDKNVFNIFIHNKLHYI